MPLHNLTPPQVTLLMSLHHKPRYIAQSYRPLQPLVEQELIRPRSVTNRLSLSGELYELTLQGKLLVQAILQERADIENGK